MATDVPLIKTDSRFLADDKLTKLTVELPTQLHHKFIAYPELLARESGQIATDSVRLTIPMLERFIATDGRSAKARRQINP